MTDNNLLQPAGLLRVIACIFYDAILLAAVLFLSTLAFLAIPADMRDTDPFIQVGKVIFYIGIAYLYFSFFWRRSGQTPGMRAWRTYLTDCKGSLPTRMAVLRRFLAAMLSWALAGTGFLWIIVDSNRRSLHDHLSGTCLMAVKKNRT